MTDVEGAIRDGFAIALRRPGYLFLDLLWKGIWLICTMACLGGLLAWLAYELQSLDPLDGSISAAGDLAGAVILRVLWSWYGSVLIWSAILILASSVTIWILLEAYFRVRLFRKLRTRRLFPEKSGRMSGERTGDRSGFFVFLLSSLITKLSLLSAAIVLGTMAFGRYWIVPLRAWPEIWAETWGAVIVALVAMMGISFLLRVIEAMIRADAVELITRKLFEVAGIVGTLMALEAFIGMSVLVAVTAGFLSVTSPDRFIAMIIISVFCVVILSVLRSFLLIVRFSAIDIVRRDVAGV